MSFAALPATAAWSHRDTRSGFEVVYFERLGDGGLRIDGCTTALDEDGTWFVEYSITVAADWHTRAARVTGRSLSGRREVVLESTGIGHWLVDGKPAQRLNGCLDVDLESSALTNALPIQRMDPPVGTRVATPAVYIRAGDLSVHRLEQQYQRTADANGHYRFEYLAPAFDFTSQLIYDEAGLVLEYPGIATRAG
ncbi:putative glycolipid-binding domain-containing protein [Nocardia sp. NBC_01503]|uniref:putative glycolipid-binding domain-containing protein n=1 Tax=Nocardia sp. NBC_01503 TaxID=2975997 RepID=UPI002E7B7B26|nr:putative glycolipid-binding domain-containing protein [Nocardia sp. NBC_01503]WTL29462.1 putative glycolipid-binding domain-containing protein [Nocardia sp. NBC_01503]